MLLEDLLSDLTHITYAMLAACKDKNWTKLAALEHERRPAFEHFIHDLSGLPDSLIEQHKDQLEQLFKLEQSLLAASSLERDQCFSELEQVNRGARACLAYQSHS